MKRITQSWWKACLNNPEKLEHWLVSLYNNEKDAEKRFLNFAKDYCQGDPEAYQIFSEIARQEREHSLLVEKVLENRGIKKYEKSSSNGRYWRNTVPCIVDKQTAAAIGAYAEGLSLRRMRTIIKDPETPVDLKEMFLIIEPEESYHAKVLEKIATKWGMKSVRDCHDKGLEELGLKIKSSK